MVAERLKGGESRNGHGRRFLERHVGGLRHESNLPGRCVLRPRCAPCAEDLVTRLKLLDVTPDGFDAT